MRSGVRAVTIQNEDAGGSAAAPPPPAEEAWRKFATLAACPFRLNY